MRKFGKKVKKLKWAGLVSAVIFGCSVAPGSLWAENIFTDKVDKGDFSIGGRALWYNPIDGDADWRGGAQARWYLNDVFALEGSMDYRKNDFGDTTVRTFPLQVSGLMYVIPDGRLSPFLIGGGGWYYTDVDGPGGAEDVQQRFGLHGGAGLQLMLTPHWSVDGSYRFVWLERIRPAGTGGKLQDEGHMVTIGLNYHFDFDRREFDRRDFDRQ